MTLRAALAAAVLLSSCSVALPQPTASPEPQPTATASVVPTAQPTITASVSPSPIALPTGVQLSAPSSSVVWAFVGSQRLFRSSDRGTTWEERPVPASFDGGVSFVSEREGWLMRPGSPATQCMLQSVRIWRTVDAGATYQQIPEVAAAFSSGPTGIAPGQCKDSVSFADATRGFISAWSQNAPALIYRTTDGGHTWAASAPLPDPRGPSEPGRSALHPGRVKTLGATLLVTATGQRLDGVDLYVFRSVDGGVTWSHIATAPVLADVAFVTPSRWLQLSQAGRSKETTDAGASWHDFPSNYGSAAPISPGTAFGSADVGYATVRGSLQRTIDGGTSWTPIRTPGT